MSQTQEVRGVATSIRTAGGTTYVRYHGTDVVAFNSRHVWLDSGGWQTVTTKLRMNQASNQFDLGYRVYQKDFQWYVNTPNGVVEFQDNMVISRR